MAHQDNEDLITELLARIERLELNESSLQQEVRELRTILQETEAQLESHAIAVEVVQPATQATSNNIVSDRHGNKITIGCNARTLTKGRFRERTGIVSKIKLPWVYIIDSTGREQRRIATNLCVEN